MVPGDGTKGLLEPTTDQRGPKNVCVCAIVCVRQWSRNEAESEICLCVFKWACFQMHVCKCVFSFSPSLLCFLGIVQPGSHWLSLKRTWQTKAASRRPNSKSLFFGFIVSFTGEHQANQLYLLTSIFHLTSKANRTNLKKNVLHQS